MVNKWFGYQQTFTNVNEQNLLESLMIEAIQCRGQDFYYLPQTLVNTNQILGESTVKSYNTYYIIECYPNNIMGFGGEKNLLSKFGLQIQKTASLIMSIKRFNEEIQKGPYNIPSTNIIDQRENPKIGDLIYWPLTKDIFEITDFDAETIFYQLGKNYVWELTIEKLKYANHVFNTGFSDIDSIATRYQNNNSIVNNPIADNTNLQNSVDSILNKTEPDPFSLDQY